MGLFDIIGDMAELPFKALRVPAKVIKAVDRATLDSGLGEEIDKATDATVGKVGRAINDTITELDD